MRQHLESLLEERRETDKKMTMFKFRKFAKNLEGTFYEKIQVLKSHQVSYIMCMHACVFDNNGNVEFFFLRLNILFLFTKII